MRKTSKIDELSDTLQKNVEFHIYDKYSDLMNIIGDVNNSRGGVLS